MLSEINLTKISQPLKCKYFKEIWGEALGPRFLVSAFRFVYYQEFIVVKSKICNAVVITQDVEGYNSTVAKDSYLLSIFVYLYLLQM